MTQGVIDAWKALGASEQDLKNAKEGAQFIGQYVIANPVNNLGHMMPSFAVDLLTGGATKAYDILKAGSEAIGALGGRKLLEQLVGGVQAAMSNPGFGVVFATEFFGDMDEKLERGEKPTATDAIWTMAGAYFNALIEYGGGDVASGFQALLMDEVQGLKGFIHSEAGEGVEEITQLFTGRVCENISSVLQGNGTKYKLYSDKPGEALLCFAEYWDVTWQTWISTGIASGTKYVAGTLANGIVKANMGEELEPDEREAVEAFTKTWDEKMAEAENHDQFEAAANGTEQETATNKNTVEEPIETLPEPAPKERPKEAQARENAEFEAQKAEAQEAQNREAAYVPDGATDGAKHVGAVSTEDDSDYTGWHEKGGKHTGQYESQEEEYQGRHQKKAEQQEPQEQAGDNTTDDDGVVDDGVTQFTAHAGVEDKTDTDGNNFQECNDDKEDHQPHRNSGAILFVLLLDFVYQQVE